METDEYKKIIAIHESGHAIMCLLLKMQGHPVEFVSATIVPDDSSAGMVSYQIAKSLVDVPKEQIKELYLTAHIKIAGLIAEEIAFSEADQQRLSRCWDDLVEYDERIADICDLSDDYEYVALHDDIREKVENELRSHWHIVEAFADALLKHKTIDRSFAERLFLEKFGIEPDELI